MKNIKETLSQYNISGLLEQYGSPLVVADPEIIRERCQILKHFFPGVHFYFAVKTNFNPHLVEIVKNEGFGIDAVSPGEVNLGLRLGVPSSKIVYNENNMTDKDMEVSFEAGIKLNIGSLSRLQKYVQKYPGSEVGIRINGDIAAACHDTNLTAGPDSKFGIHFTEVETALKIAGEQGVKIVRAHQHIGSGWLEEGPFLEAMDVLFREVEKMSDVNSLDFGGGFGVPYHLEEKHLDYENLSKKFFEKIERFEMKMGRKYQYAFEPGRFITCESAALLISANTRKVGSEGRVFIGTDSGMNHLIRPAMYGSYHEIINLSNPSEVQEVVDICGNMCESADFFAKDRQMPEIREEDILAILNVGAYGLVQSQPYSLRGNPAEVLLEEGASRLIRRRETFEDLMSTFDYDFTS